MKKGMKRSESGGRAGGVVEVCVFVRRPLLFASLQWREELHLSLSFISACITHIFVELVILSQPPSLSSSPKKGNKERGHFFPPVFSEFVVTQSIGPLIFSSLPPRNALLSCALLPPLAASEHPKSSQPLSRASRAQSGVP